MKVRTTMHPHVGFDATLSFPLAAGVAFAYPASPILSTPSSLSLTLPNPSLTHAPSYRAYSTPIAFDYCRYASSPLARVHIKKDTAEALANPTLPPPLPFFIPIKSFYINGMIDPAQTIHVCFFFLFLIFNNLFFLSGSLFIYKFVIHHYLC